MKFIPGVSGLIIFRYLNKISNANQIAPYQSRCKDFEWRVNLKPNDEIDVCNNSSRWCSATVLETKQSEEENDYPAKEVLIGRLIKPSPFYMRIGYRVYDEEGDREDLEGRSYFGYPRQYDEWLNISDPRLAK